MLSSRSTVKCRDVTFAKIEECVLEALCLLLVVDVWTLYNGDDNYKLLCNSITKHYLLAGFIIRLSGY